MQYDEHIGHGASTVVHILLISKALTIICAIHNLKALHSIHINKQKRRYRLQKVSNAFLVFKIIYSQATWLV